MGKARDGNRAQLIQAASLDHGWTTDWDRTKCQRLVGVWRVSFLVHVFQGFSCANTKMLHDLPLFEAFFSMIMFMLLCVAVLCLALSACNMLPRLEWQRLRVSIIWWPRRAKGYVLRYTFKTLLEFFIDKDRKIAFLIFILYLAFASMW